MTPVTPLLEPTPRDARPADPVGVGVDFDAHLHHALERGDTPEPETPADDDVRDIADDAAGAAAVLVAPPGRSRPALPPGLAIAIAHAPDHAAVHEVAARLGVPTAGTAPAQELGDPSVATDPTEPTEPAATPGLSVDADPIVVDAPSAPTDTAAVAADTDSPPVDTAMTGETAVGTDSPPVDTVMTRDDTDSPPVDTNMAGETAVDTAAPPTDRPTTPTGAGADTEADTDAHADPRVVAGDRAVAAGAGRADHDPPRIVHDPITSRRPVEAPRGIDSVAIGHATPAGVSGQRAPATGAPVGPPPITPAQVAERVLEAVRSARAGGHDEVRLSIRLDPPELGSVIVDVAMHGDRVHVTMRAEVADAATALHGRRADIVRALDSSGLGLAGFDVGSSHDEGGRHGHGSAPTRAGRTATPTTDESDDRPAPADDGVLRM